MSRFVLRAGVVVGLVAALLVPAAVAQAATTSKNLIHNGGGEAAAGSPDGSVVPVPRWTVPSGGQFTAVQYGASGGFPFPSDPGPANRGANFFAGGPSGGTETATQTLSLRDYLAAIDAGTATFTLSGYLGGYASQEDNATLTVAWLNSGGATLASRTIGPVTATQRNGATGLLRRNGKGSIPTGARKALVTVTLTKVDGSYDDGYADNLSLTITTP